MAQGARVPGRAGSRPGRSRGRRWPRSAAASTGRPVDRYWRRRPGHRSRPGHLLGDRPQVIARSAPCSAPGSGATRLSGVVSRGAATCPAPEPTSPAHRSAGTDRPSVAALLLGGVGIDPAHSAAWPRRIGPGQPGPLLVRCGGGTGDGGRGARDGAGGRVAGAGSGVVAGRIDHPHGRAAPGAGGLRGGTVRSGCHRRRFSATVSATTAPRMRGMEAPRLVGASCPARGPPGSRARRRAPGRLG